MQLSRYRIARAVFCSFAVAGFLNACSGAGSPNASNGPAAFIPQELAAPHHVKANAHVAIAEVPISAATYSDAPLIVSASKTGSVSFGSFNGSAGYSLPDDYCYALPGGNCPDGYYLGTYASGVFSEAAPQGADGTMCPGGVGFCCPAQTYGCRAFGVSAIDAADFPQVMWASLYNFFAATQPGFPWGELNYGNSGTATMPPAPWNVSAGGSPPNTDTIVLSIVRAPNGTLWISGGGPSGAQGNPATLPTAYQGLDNSDYLLLANGPNRNVWGLSHADGSGPSSYTSQSYIFEFGPTGSALHTYVVSSYVAHIAGDGDGLFFTDTGRNAIGRIDRNGHLTEYAIPTANSGAYDITVGNDRTVWFTESHAGKVGRLIGRGKFDEYVLPTQGAVPAGIAATPSGCITRAIWVGEVAPANKLAEITY